ncbi:hypothetical protein [Paraclostridium bifermentans]|uniref:hypothetical protein n=1 Tax=Paraclostridium bifermentans TaxID=1490 RepID=UPI0025AFE793|nr:hypothetical protein [Paraclostridium bifermentans]
MMNLLTSNLDFFESKVKGKQVYILSFDIDHDLYLIKFNNYKVFKVNKKSNELNLEFSNEDLDEILNDIEDYCKKAGIKSFWSPNEMWKNYKLSPKQKDLSKSWNIKFNNSWEFHQYMSKYIAYKVLNELV